MAPNEKGKMMPLEAAPDIQTFLQDNNIYSTSFPMDAKISFGTDRSTFTADALEDSKMESVMLRRLSEGEILLDRVNPLSPPRPYTDSTYENISSVNATSSGQCIFGLTI